MNHLLVLGLALFLGGSYTDVQGRFRVDLPRGWEFSPQPGDVSGAYFRKREQGMLANATVRVMNFPQPVPLDAFAARIAAASDQEPGYRLMFSQPTTVAGLPAVKRRFLAAISADGKWSKIVEQRILVADNIGYVVHCETVADTFTAFEKEFNVMFQTFAPKNGLAVIPKKHKRFRLDPRRFTGVWEGGGHSIRFTPSGAVMLDGVAGTYRVDNGVLVLNLGDTKRVHEFELSDKVLVIMGGSFGEGQAFRHMAPRDSSGGD